MNLLAHVGKRLYWLGYRMQEPSIRRGISLLTAVGLEWSKGEEESKLLERHMAGEKLELGLTFRTTELTSAYSKGEQ